MKPDPLANLQSLLKRGREISVNAVRAATDAPDAAGKRRKVVILIGGAIFAAAVVIYAATHFLGGDPSERIAIDPTQLVSAIPVSTQEFKQVVVLTGEARPVRDIQVYAPATGVRILQLLADEGDMVRAGQPLARLDTALANAQIQLSRANVAEAESAAIRARGEYQRAESIRDSGALSAEAIEQRRAAATAADARLSAARAQMQETNARLQGGYVRAPAAGLVISRSAEIGRPVDGQMLFRIAGDNALEVAADVAEDDVLALRVGQHARFSLADGSAIEATLRRGPASIDSRTRTGQALFDLPLNSSVRAGMFLRGEAELAARQALAAPQSSILYSDRQAYVFVIGDDSRARRVDVTLGAREGDMVEITQGLDDGMRIVGAGAAFLQDGDLIRTVEPAPAAESPERHSEIELRGRTG